MLNNWQKLIAMSPGQMARWLLEHTADGLCDTACAVCEYKTDCDGSNDLECKYSDVELIEKFLLQAAEEG